MGEKIPKFYSYKSQPEAFKLVLIFPANGPHKTKLVSFEILIFFLFLKFFFFFLENSNSLFYIMEQEQINVWKMSDYRGKCGTLE